MDARRQPLLTELGRRLREAREARGLSVSELARRSRTSRRHVTEAEAGRANLSITRLADLADTLDVPLGRLCDLGRSPRESGRVALVGLRGAGKSTVGRALALRLEVPFVELDRRVEERAGLSLGEIFDLHGARRYRALEAEALEEVLAEGQGQVLAAGGSIVTAPETYARLRDTCTTVWLRAKPEEHFQRVVAQGDGRPMRDRPRALDELRAMLEEREPLYARCATRIDTDHCEVDKLVEELARRLEA